MPATAARRTRAATPAATTGSAGRRRAGSCAGCGQGASRRVVVPWLIDDKYSRRGRGAAARRTPRRGGGLRGRRWDHSRRRPLLESLPAPGRLQPSTPAVTPPDGAAPSAAPRASAVGAGGRRLRPPIRTAPATSAAATTKARTTRAIAAVVEVGPACGRDGAGRATAGAASASAASATAASRMTSTGRLLRGLRLRDITSPSSVAGAGYSLGAVAWRVFTHSG